MRYKVFCTKRDCPLAVAWFRDLPMAELVAFAHHNRTDSNHHVDVLDTEPNTPVVIDSPIANSAAAASFNSDETGNHPRGAP